MDKKYYTQQEIMDLFSVSLATVNNWIKTGELTSVQLTEEEFKSQNIKSKKTLISEESVEQFKKIVGIEKLNKRANKQQKDNHDHKDLSEKLLIQLKNNELDANQIGVLYENGLSNSHKNKEGIYYTPENLLSRLFKNVTHIDNEKTFCDPVVVLVIF